MEREHEVEFVCGFAFGLGRTERIGRHKTLICTVGPTRGES